jgi:hypothetical protein
MKIQKNVQWKEKTFTWTVKSLQSYSKIKIDLQQQCGRQQDQTPDGTKLLRNTVTQKIGYDVNNDVKYLITKNNRNAQINTESKNKSYNARQLKLPQ